MMENLKEFEYDEVYVEAKTLSSIFKAYSIVTCLSKISLHLLKDHPTFLQ